MNILKRQDLLPLEQYAGERASFRARVMAHKQSRRVAIGKHACLYFEDRLTVHYQIQEMLRIEKIFEPQEIEEELKAYNPLIPDGNNWKATFMLEYEDVEERRVALANLHGIATKVWMQVGDQARVFAIADEDMDREDSDKTSAVHFLRFDLTPQMVTAAKAGAAISSGIDHPHYRYETALDDLARAALVADLA
ncbi:MAG TPA: DUF3501 family protein [Acidiferrobacter sp.]|nr:DUF3501 family protein [Acidiferrobacter sp.]